MVRHGRRVTFQLAEVAVRSPPNPAQRPKTSTPKPSPRGYGFPKAKAERFRPRRNPRRCIRGIAEGDAGRVHAVETRCEACQDDNAL